MNVIQILQNKFVRAAGAAAVATQVAGCAPGGGNFMANVDPGVAAAAGAALGYGIGNELNDDWGGYAGGALGAAIANAASNSARACETTTALDRNAGRDNRTNRVIYDETTQSQSQNCTTYGGVQSTSPNPRIF